MIIFTTKKCILHGLLIIKHHQINLINYFVGYVLRNSRIHGLADTRDTIAIRRRHHTHAQLYDYRLL